MTKNNNKDDKKIRLDDKPVKNQLKQIPPPLEISTSRKHSTDYFTKDGFTLRTGYSDKREWYLLPIKEGLDNTIDFLWKYYRGKNAYVNVNVTRNEELLQIRIRNSNPGNVQVFKDLNEVFNFDMRHGSKHDLHVISRGMLGDAMKQILSLGYILLHINDDGTELAEKQWEYPLIIRHNKQEWKIYLHCNKAKQEHEVKLKKSPEKLTHTDTEIEVVLPIIDEVRNTLNREYIEQFCKKYSILTTDISFSFYIQVDNAKLPQLARKVPNRNPSTTNTDDDDDLATELVSAISRIHSKDESNIKVESLSPIVSSEVWNNSDSIHSYLPEEFMNRIANVHDKELITIYDVLRSFREGTNIKKNTKVKRSVASLLDSPNMHKEIEELYRQLKNALPPQRKISLPYSKRKERIDELVSRIGKIYDIDKNKKASYRIEHGYFCDGRILYPYAFEIIGIPLADPTSDTTRFIGAVNYSISPKSIKFEGEYDLDGGYVEGNIDDVLRSCGFHKHSAKKSRLPCIIIGNLITLRRNPHSYDKSSLDISPFANIIVRAAKKMAFKIPTFRAAGYIINPKGEDYSDARQKKINRKASAKGLLRQFLMKERGFQQMNKLQEWTLSTVWYLFQPVMEKAGIEVKRETITGYIREICKDAGITRESLGIFAGARAELYFDGEWSSVSFGRIRDLAEKGTDIVCIEKQGVPEVLTEWADKYGIALLNSRGHLTEYGKELMDTARKSGTLVAIMVDYDLPGIKIASETPTDMPWIGVNFVMLEYFHLTKEEVSIPAESRQYERYVTKLVSEGKHSSKSKNDNAGKVDTRFRVVDLEFLKYRRIEIDAILAKVGGEKFFEYIIYSLNSISPTRNYNRAIDLSTELFNLENIQILPDAVRKFFEYIQKMSDAATEKAKGSIRFELENVRGFIDVHEKKDEICEQLAEVLVKDRNMGVILSKCVEWMQSSIPPGSEKANIGNKNKVSSRRKRQIKR